ncbi:hypothetical protein V8C86DRAFT_2647443 [Haematococcus lacustris]
MSTWHKAAEADSVWEGQQAILPFLFCIVWLALSIAVFVLSYFTSKAAIAAGLHSRSPWLMCDIILAYVVLVASIVGFIMLTAYVLRSNNNRNNSQWRSGHRSSGSWVGC